MSKPICIYGLGHLGNVVAACVASVGKTVIGVDCSMSPHYELPDEPGLKQLAHIDPQHLSFSMSDDPTIIKQSRLIWVTFDTPVDNNNRGHPEWIAEQLAFIRPYVQDNSLIVVSSQVPVGFTHTLESEWRSHQPSITFAYIPENIRRGHAVEDFLTQPRVVIGVDNTISRDTLTELVNPFTKCIVWMSLDAAEMSKHALNGFLAVSAAYANELGRLADTLGINYQDVERALRSDPRIGQQAYIRSGEPIQGGSLLREINVLRQFATTHNLPIPVIDAVESSNQLQVHW